MPVFTNLEAQQSIDIEIAAHHAAIIDLRHKRNSLAAVYSLPEDILSLIFVLCKDSSKVKDIPTLWRTILSVCSQWRHLALASPRFSNTITLSHTGNISAMLAHSGELPIRLYCPFNEMYGKKAKDNSRTAFRDVLDKGGHRLERLSITCASWNNETMDELFETLQTCRAASLQEMTINHTGSHFDLAHIPRHPFPWTSTPSLRNLTLLNTLVSLDMPPLPHLTHLTLTCNRWPSDGGVPVPYAIRFLQKTPNVEVVNINYIVKPWPSTPFPGMDDGVPKESIPLSSLRSLTITSDPLNGSEFMRCLSLPPAARLRVHLTKDMEYSTSTISHKQVLAKAALTSLLSGLATSSLDLTSQEISIIFGFGQGIRLMIYLGALDPEKAHVDVSNQDSILELRDFMDILDSSNFNSHATKLTLFNEAANSDGDCRVPRGGKKQLAVMEAPFWRKVLPTFESLRTLCIFNTTLSFFVAILQPPSIILRDQEQEQVTLSPAFLDFKQNPLLKRVYLTAVECFPPRIVTPVEASDKVSSSTTSPSTATPPTPVADDTVEEHHNSPPAVTKQDEVNLEKGKMEEDEEDVGAGIINLVHILKKRQEAGMPRIRLIFERCGITLRQVQLLRAHAKVHFRNN